MIIAPFFSLMTLDTLSATKGRSSLRETEPIARLELLQSSSTLPSVSQYIAAREANRMATEPAEEIVQKLKRLLQDPEAFEAGEEPPSENAIRELERILTAAQDTGAVFPKSTVGTYYGEIDVTWENDNKLLRLIVYSDRGRQSRLYWQTDAGSILTRGESVAVTSPQDLVSKLGWVRLG